MRQTSFPVIGTGRALTAVVTAAVLAAGCSGSGGGNGEPPADTVAPTVSVNSTPGIVSRTVTLGVTASDNVGVSRVEFFVDGTSVGTDAAAPFTVDWDTGAVADGDHSITASAQDAAGNSATSSSVTVTVDNVRDYAVSASSAEVFPVTDSSASASGSFTVNLATGEIGGSITVEGFDATAAHIHDGFAGVNGPVAIGLEQSATEPATWQIPDATVTTDDVIDRLLVGALYVNAHSAAYPGGEVRAQILPEGFQLLLVDLAGIEEVPEVVTSARGRGAVTVNTATGATVIHVNTTDSNGAPATLPGVTAAHLHSGRAGVNGPVVIGLEQDAGLASHWFNDTGMLDEAGLAGLLSASTYLNVHSSDHTSGEIRGQVVPDGYVVVVSRVNGEQQAPEPLVTFARGTAAVTVEMAGGAADVVLNVTGADDATAAHVHSQFAGTNGPVVIGLEKDPATPTRWRSNGATMTGSQMDLLAAGGLYVNVHTPANPAGEARGQLLPAGVELVVSHLNGAQEAPAAVATDANGRASTTVDTVARRLTIHVHTAGVDDATGAHIHLGERGVAGPVEVGLTQDGAAPSHWFATDIALTDGQLASYLAGEFYVNVHTPANPAGEIRGQIELGGVVPFQYADVQSLVFDVTCATSECHTGPGAPLGLDLGADASHGNLVGQASQGVPELLRVAPGDAPASYLIRKLDGGPGIVGERMPNGLPALDPVTIDRMRAWVNAGALPAPQPPADTVAPIVTLGALPDPISGTVALTATATDDVGVTLVRWRVGGNVVGTDASAPFSLDWDSTTVADGPVTVDAQALDAAGNVGTSALSTSTVSNATGGVDPFTFTEIQTQIFDMSCALSGCHRGANPAGQMDLSAPAYSDIVNVASSEKPALLRVNPGNASQSYLIHKLEGGPDIAGARMPFGGPFLDQATIDRIRAWIDAGAPNN